MFAYIFPNTYLMKIHELDTVNSNKRCSWFYRTTPFYRSKVLKLVFFLDKIVLQRFPFSLPFALSFHTIIIIFMLYCYVILCYNLLHKTILNIEEGWNISVSRRGTKRSEEVHYTSKWIKQSSIIQNWFYKKFRESNCVGSFDWKLQFHYL